MKKFTLTNKTFEHITYYKAGKGLPLFLVHGYPANYLLWREVLPVLSEKYTILLPSFFEKDNDWLNNNSQTSTTQLALAFKDILDNEGIYKIVYAGHSMGGYMGFEFAKLFPEYLSGLSLIHSSPIPDDEDRVEGRRKTVEILKNGGKRLFLKKMIPSLFTEQFCEENKEVVNKQYEEAINVDDKSLIAFYEAIMYRNNSSNWGSQLKIPIQYIMGEQDKLTDVKKDLVSENLSFVSFVNIYKDIGHMSMLESPQQMANDLDKFINYCWQIHQSNE